MKKGIGRLAIISVFILYVLATFGHAADRLVLLNTFAGKGEQAGKINSVSELAFDINGNIYTADSSNHKIVVYDQNGNYLREFGKYGSDPGELNSPNRLAVDRLGNIYVVDYHDLSLTSDPGSDKRSYTRIQKFSPSGAFLWSLGSPGKGNGEFIGIGDIEIDNQGNLYAIDSGNHRVQKFNSNGKFLLVFGGIGTEEGKFESPAMLQADSENNIFVFDLYNYRVQKFNSSGKFLLAFGKEGSNDGEFKYVYPVRMYFDKEGRLCVLTTYSFYTSGKRRQLRCLIQKFDTAGNYKGKLYAYERYYDDDTSYSLNFLSADAQDNIYLFHGREKTINKFRFSSVLVNWESMSKNYSLELRVPSSGSKYDYQSYTSVATTENTRKLSGWNPVQNIYLYYEHDDRTNINFNNSLSYSVITGPRDDISSTTHSSWEGTETIFEHNSSIQLRYIFDKTKNKDFTYNLGYSYRNAKTEWAKTAPEENSPSTSERIYTNLNFDLTDFSDLEIGYNKSLYQSGYDTLYYNYQSTSTSDNDYMYLKYHTDF